MLGDWEQRYRELKACLDRLEEIYTTGQAGGSAMAQSDLQAFFDRSIALGEKVAQHLSVSLKELQNQIMALSDPWIAISRDLAIASKHAERTQKHWAGDPDLAFVQQNATVFVQTARATFSVSTGKLVNLPADPPNAPVKSAHSWKVAYRRPGTTTTETLDALHIARDTFTQWTSVLATWGLALPDLS